MSIVLAARIYLETVSPSPAEVLYVHLGAGSKLTALS